MNTTGSSAFLDQIGIGSFDWGYLAAGILGLAVLMLIVLILLIVQIVKVNRLKKRLDRFVLGKDGASLEVQKAYMKAFGIVSSGTAVLGDGVAVFKVYKRPETDITVGLRGVMP